MKACKPFIYSVKQSITLKTIGWLHSQLEGLTEDLHDIYNKIRGRSEQWIVGVSVGMRYKRVVVILYTYKEYFLLVSPVLSWSQSTAVGSGEH